jgi:hypothetical protein
MCAKHLKYQRRPMTVAYIATKWRQTTKSRTERYTKSCQLEGTHRRSVEGGKDRKEEIKEST